MTDFVVTVIATYGRPLEISRLLKSLGEIKEGLGAVVVVDNANEPGIRTIVENAPCNAHYFSPGMNLGCGGGLHFGQVKVLELFGDQLTHLWILDDDAVVPPNAIEVMTCEMRNQSAEAACPMVTDASGRIGWFPGLLDTKAFHAIRNLSTPDEYIAQCGLKPVKFWWSTGVSLLVTRRVMLELGYHRADYWIRGEDLEFSMRVTSKFKGIFVPSVTVKHIQVEDLKDATLNDSEYFKHAAMLQNQWYTSLYLPHGRLLIWTIPGNYWRFLKTWSWFSIIDALRAFWFGGIIGKPAGAKNGDFFQQKDKSRNQ